MKLIYISKGRVYGGKMAKIISIINLKGGVAKTTTTVGLAQVLSTEFNKKVLVIDLDAQTNATTMLIGEEKWLEVNKDKQTIAQLFYEGVYPKSEKIFDINKAILKGVSNIDEVKFLDLKIANWIVDLGVKNFVKDFFSGNNNLAMEFNDGNVLIDKSNFKGVVLNNISIDSKMLKLDMRIDLEKLI